MLLATEIASPTVTRSPTICTIAETHAAGLEPSNERLAYAGYPAVDYKYAQMGPCNRHHLLFFAKSWTSRGHYALLLREMPYFSYYLPVKELHNNLHAMTRSGVPLPDGLAITAAYRFVTAGIESGQLSEHDSLPARLTLLMQLFEGAPRTQDALRRQLEIVTTFDAKHHLA